jgi:ribosomal protein S10
MTKITSLADEIRSRIAQPPEAAQPEVKKTKAKAPKTEAAILQLIRDYDNANHKSLVHVRFDEKTVQTLNHFKMATGVDVTRLVAFSVQQLFEQNPELKSIIKQFIQNVNL